MKTLIQKLPKSKVELKIELSPEEFDSFFEKAVFNLGKDLKIEGFRKGKAPRKIIEEKVGASKILAETADLAIRESYLRAVLENKIEAISQPEIQITKLAKGSPLEFKAEIFVLPEINLPDYKIISAKIKRNKIIVGDKEVEKTLTWLQKSRAKFTLKREPAQFGDFVEIEFQSPQIEEGRSRKDGFILGEGHFIPGFEENLKGMVESSEKEFPLKFPENYLQKEFSGKEANFKVKMNSIQKVELPELNDDFVKSFGKFENLPALRKSVKSGITQEKEMAENSRISQEIIKKLSEGSSFEIPDVLIEEEKNRILDDLKSKVAENLKISFEEYLDKIKKTEKDLKDSFSKDARKNISDFLILREITKREKIEASATETENEINKILKNLPLEKAKELDLKSLKIYIEDEIKRGKTLKFLESLVK